MVSGRKTQTCKKSNLFTLLHHVDMKILRNIYLKSIIPFMCLNEMMTSGCILSLFLLLTWGKKCLLCF